MRRAVPITLVILGCAALWLFAKSKSDVKSEVTIYDPNLAQEWNRLYAALMVREDREGRVFGVEVLDPLLWGSSSHLLEPKSHREAIAALDDFLQTHAENRIHDPLKRALMIRDLWAIFDWSVAREPFRPEEPAYAKERQELQIRLSEVLRRLALTPKEIESLPDNYAQAVASGTFAKAYDPDHADRAFLPPDLFDQHGPWILLNGSLDGPAAPQHVTSFSGRSRFLIFLRLPAGRKATFDYIHRLWDFPEPWILRRDAPLQSEINPALPSFPAGTEVALVRQMTMFDNAGNLQPAPVTESVQIRVYRNVSSSSSDLPPDLNSAVARSGQSLFELRLDRSQLLSGKSGGLHEVARDFREPLLFSAMPGDQIEDPAFSDNWNKMIPVLRECVMCHRTPGINSLNSRAVLLKPNMLQQDPGYELPARWWENDGTVYWKQNRYDWGLLNGYWKTSTTH